MPCRKIHRFLPLFAAFLLVLVTSDRAAIPQASIPDSADIAACEHSSSGVKIRKLHLVRPDLIPYPIAYEIFC